MPDLKAANTVSTRAPPCAKIGAPKGPVWIDHHVGVAVFRQVNELCPLVVTKLDPAQMGLDYLGEDSLVVAHDDGSRALRASGVSP